MKLIARKPCSFNGKKFFIGDEIPAESVINPKEQEKMGVLTIAADNYVGHTEQEPAPAQESKITVLIRSEEGDVEFNPTPEGLQSIFDALTGNATEAEEIINQMTDGEALILLHLSDSRKAVRAAAEARGKELSEAQDGAEGEGAQDGAEGEGEQ